MRVKIAASLVHITPFALSAVALFGARPAARQPVWGNDLLPKQPPARNALPSSDDKTGPTSLSMPHR